MQQPKILEILTICALWQKIWIAPINRMMNGLPITAQLIKMLLQTDQALPTRTELPERNLMQEDFCPELKLTNKRKTN
ncbi:hypothetical protein D3C85_1586160 [compost metagenome]